MGIERHTRPTKTEVLQEIRARVAKLPNCRMSHDVVLKDGPQTYKHASILHFTKPGSNEVTHEELRLNDYGFTVSGGIDYSTDKRLKSWGCRDQEIEQLRIFLENYKGITVPGRHSVVNSQMLPAFQDFIAAIGDADLKTDQLLDLIVALADRAEDIRSLPELGEKNKLRMVAAAIRVAHRSDAVVKLVRLVKEQATEERFQELLDQNWWMLGGRYIKHIPRRKWTNEETIDIMLQSADGYFDIVELKRSCEVIFKKDHGKWVVSSAVHDAINQAAHYIAEIERTRPVLFQRYGCDLFKLRAKILIGHLTVDEHDASEKRESLRMFNSHLHRIEIITYDQLVKFSEDVVMTDTLESGQEVEQEDESADGSVEDIPF